MKKLLLLHHDGVSEAIGINLERHVQIPKFFGQPTTQPCQNQSRMELR